MPSELQPWAALRRFARPRPDVEHCELCSAVLAADHQHLVELERRKLLCACDACAILFDQEGAGKYRRVPRRVRALPDFRLSDAQWHTLQIPIGLAFFFRNSEGTVVAIYPSPAGPTETLIDAAAWQDLVQDNPILEVIQPDVEALLINRMGSDRVPYLVPIDECYKLVGLVRARWQGLTGGDELWQAIGQFFTTLHERSEAG